MAASVPILSRPCRGTATWTEPLLTTVWRPPSRTTGQPFRARKRSKRSCETSRGTLGIDLDRLELRARPPQGLLAPHLEDELDGLLDVRQGLPPGLSLGDGAGELDALHRVASLRLPL